MRVGIAVGLLALLLPLNAPQEVQADGCGVYRGRSFYAPSYHRTYHEVPIVYGAPVVVVPGFSLDRTAVPTLQGFVSQTPTIQAPLQLPSFQQQQRFGMTFPQLGLTEWRPQQAAPQQQLAPAQEIEWPVAVENRQVALQMEEQQLASDVHQIDALAKGILQKRCASCHSYPGRENSAGEAIYLFGTDGKTWGPSVQKKAIVEEIKNGSMPPAGKHDPFSALSPYEKEVITLWSSLKKPRPAASAIGE